ncbi:phage DNA ejection protein [Providencia heimbachae]|uniref:phage DNA ejection protein n=1 Tax=Providencia heimbachae TaxID=333962 RepID=UPI00141A2CE9|nr:phage DNA ejection protein [Providencia heimbachae]NIH21858.1 phage DNA ejection protein [Providencia heimbachae]
MATWNQQGSGGLLGGIGQQNSNAPQASDANAAIAMIRDNNDLQRSGANNFGLQAMQGLAGLDGAYKQQQAQSREKEFQSQWGQAYANGDRDSMRKLMAAYPEQAEKITSGMKGISEDVKESLGNIASGYRMAIGTGKATDYIRENADEFRRLGIDPQQAAQIANDNPKGAMELADHIGMSALGVDKYYDVKDKMEGRIIDRDKLTETVRSNQVSEALTSRRDEQNNARGWAGVNIQQQNSNLARERFNFDKEIRVAETKDKVLERQLKNEENALKRAELEQKIAANKEKLETTKSEKYDGFINQMESADRSIKMANDILKSDGFNDFFGTNINPLSNHRIPGTSGADTASMVDTLKSQAFMAGVQQMRGMGALSDAEGKKITDSIGNLSSDMSEAQAKKSINNIIDVMKQGQERAIKKNPDDYKRYQSESSSSNQQGDYSNLWGG